MAILYGLKVNLSVAIVVMVNHTSQYTNSSSIIRSSCSTNDTDDIKSQDGPFTWDESQQGLILSSYYWGYLISQIPAGRISEVFSAKWVMFTAVALNIICTLLTPVAAQIEPLLMFLRCVEGVGGGFSFPAMHVLLSKWAPVEERSTMTTIVYAGAALGTVLSMLFSGLIYTWQSWEAVFYWMGSLPIIWCLLWTWLVQDDTTKHCYITEKERILIQKSLGDRDTSHKVQLPWKKICTSVPFLAIMITHFCNNCCWYVLLTELPKYMSQVLYFRMEENSLLSSFPYLTLWIFSLILGKWLDFGRSKKVISTTAARKISTFFASVIPAACLLAVTFVKCEHIAVVALMAVAVTTMGGMFSGVLANHIDIAPQYAGTLVGITNTFATIPGILIPIFVGEITHANQTTEQWSIVFYTVVGILAFEVVVYSIFGSGEEQSWNRSNDTIMSADNNTVDPELLKKQESKEITEL